jgi:hypothetical protein
MLVWHHFIHSFIHDWNEFLPRLCIHTVFMELFFVRTWRFFSLMLLWRLMLVVLRVGLNLLLLLLLLLRLSQNDFS